MSRDSEYRKQIVDIGRRMTQRGMVGTNEGNISIYDRETGRVYITPSGQSKEFLTEDMVIVMDMDGNYLERKEGLKSSSETVMHTRMYRLRPDVNGVVHCHAPFSSAFAISGIPIRSKSIAEMCIMFGGEIPLLPYGEPGTDKLIDGYDQHLSSDVVLLENHGMLAVGVDLMAAYSRTVTVEMLAKTIWLARVMGAERDIPEDKLAQLSTWMAKQAARN